MRFTVWLAEIADVIESEWTWKWVCPTDQLERYKIEKNLTAVTSLKRSHATRTWIWGISLIATVLLRDIQSHRGVDIGAGSIEREVRQELSVDEVTSGSTLCILARLIVGIHLERERVALYRESSSFSMV
jgi:hypothetical protein